MWSGLYSNEFNEKQNKKSFQIYLIALLACPLPAKVQLQIRPALFRLSSYIVSSQRFTSDRTFGNYFGVAVAFRSDVYPIRTDAISGVQSVHAGALPLFCQGLVKIIERSHSWRRWLFLLLPFVSFIFIHSSSSVSRTVFNSL